MDLDSRPNLEVGLQDCQEDLAVRRGRTLLGKACNVIYQCYNILAVFTAHTKDLCF